MSATAQPSARSARRARPRSSLPLSIAPQLPMPAVWPPEGADWLYEIDFDGERVLARCEGGHATLHTAAGDDCTARYPSIARAIEALGADDTWLDGEAVAVDDADADAPVRYALFDVMFADGVDLRARPLVWRRARLAQLLGETPPAPLVLSTELAGDGASLLTEACGHGLAGLIAKRRDARYESGRARTWRELKCCAREAASLPAREAPAVVRVAGVAITNPHRPITHSDGATKADVARYHERMAPWLMRHVARRPLALVRCTGGDLDRCFFQKHMGREQGNAGDPEDPYVLLPTRRALIEAVQNGMIELHTWGASAPNLDRPDRITLDLDPDAAVGWPQLRDAASRVRALLDDLGLRWFVKTTGGKGLHFVVPIERRHSWDEAKAFAGALARRLAAAHPDAFTATMSKSERAGRVFVDYLRNAAGATAIAAYALRARPGLPVSMPIEWEALDEDVRGARFNWRNVPQIVASRARDPWADYGETRQRLSAALVRKVR